MIDLTACVATGYPSVHRLSVLSARLQLLIEERWSGTTGEHRQVGRLTDSVDYAAKPSKRKKLAFSSILSSILFPILSYPDA